jgi:folate-binding protein YgfZ
LTTTFYELKSVGLISFSGADAASFLHAQLTSDVAALPSPRTQYSGYCSPKGRLLATFLLWRREEEIVLLLPGALRESVQSRLAKYVLRAQVTVADATARYALFGIAGEAARSALAGLNGLVPGAMHDVVAADALEVTRLPIDRYLVLSPADRADAVRAALAQTAARGEESDWWRFDVAAGIPVITPASQEQYVPQMVNLDLIGAVSYTKGCYPGQEIVARMHYLGKLKQRMYRVRTADVLSAGDPLYSRDFGPDQASGAILYTSGGVSGGREALAVIQTSSAAAGAVHLKSLDGPSVELLSLPYPIPA